jgi:GNAT superfamily N-acetyltransferase
MHIEPYQPAHLSQLTALVNAHFGVVIPGWSLPSDYIEKHLDRNPGEYVIDPWVIERKTLCALYRGRVAAAAHLLRYGTGEEIGENYQNVGDIAWLVAWPDTRDEAAALLHACHDQMQAWGVRETIVWDSVLPFPTCSGIPPQWPHITGLFEQAGYAPDPDTGEAIYGGRIETIPLPGEAPVAGVELRRIMREVSVGFVAYAGDEEIGHCYCDVDLSEGNARPALRNWAELGGMFVKEEWRSRGIGTWLVQHAAEWMRMASCDRIVLSVLPDDEERGAGRFYQRFGWQPFTRIHRSWRMRS